MRQIAGRDAEPRLRADLGALLLLPEAVFFGQRRSALQAGQLMHYDLEVSGFPSSHAGHIVLLGLKDQDYPGTKRIEDWPTWDLPILRWGKKQGAVVGFAHSGWGLEIQDKNLPSYEMPGFDGIGANEYIVDVTYPDTVDFISTVDTPYAWELNIWYHTLNVGLSHAHQRRDGFPLHLRRRVGLGRTLRQARWRHGLRRVAEEHEGGPQLRVGRKEPSDGFQGERPGRRRRAAVERGRKPCTSALA